MLAVVLIVAFFVFFCWLTKRSFERRAEKAASGQLQSPLHRFGSASVLLLFMLVTWIVIIYQRDQDVPVFLWIVALADVAGIVLVNRALKWRFGQGLLF